MNHIFLLLLILALITSCEKKVSQKTTFTYEEQSLQRLKTLEIPQKFLHEQELSEVMRYVNLSLEEDSHLSSVDRFLLPAYIVNAQRDFAILSHEISGNPVGSFAPITLAIIRLFDPKLGVKGLEESAFDAYSLAIAAPIVEQAQLRLEDERKKIHNYPIQDEEGSWQPTDGYFGLNYGSVMPWYLTSCDEFRCAEPNSKPTFMNEQCHLVKEAMANLDNEKRMAIYFWAGMMQKDSGDWTAIAEEYMQMHQIPLEKRLLVRSVLVSAQTDALAAAFDSKYTYWIKRPSMEDPTIHPLIPAPSHPSYPSGHSTVGKTSAIILSHFFPENDQEWESLAEQAGMSRIWGGIHYFMDHEEGKKLGNKIAEKTLEKL